MDIKVIYSYGGKFNKNKQQKLADQETSEVADAIVKSLKKSGHDATKLRITPSNIDSVKKIRTDVVFNLCEWTGKDYPLGVRVLKNLEDASIPHTGSDSKSYEWSSDKIIMKSVFDRRAILSPRWISVSSSDDKNLIESKLSFLKFPIIIKPAYEHCAIGISYKSVIHTKRGSVSKILKLLKNYNEPILIEEYIKGREFTTTVIKNRGLHVFPPAEVKFATKNQDKILSFATKWLDSGDSYSSVVVKEKLLAKRLKEISAEIFKKMGCRGYIRIDFRLRAKKIYVLEVNINPSIWPEECYGLTVSTEADGWSFEKLVDEISRAAL